jgi:hypothetical protein
MGWYLVPSFSLPLVFSFVRLYIINTLFDILHLSSFRYIDKFQLLLTYYRRNSRIQSFRFKFAVRLFLFSLDGHTTS